MQLLRVIIGQYLPGDSVVHRLDPRAKIILSIVFMVSVFLVQSFPGYGLSLLYVLLALCLARVRLGHMWRGLRPLGLIILITVGLNAFFVEGRILAEFGPFTLSYEGLREAGLIASRLMLLVVGGSILTLTTPPLRLADGLESLLKPTQRLGVPVHEMAMMMTIALRFIPTLLEETERIMRAQMARGAAFESKNPVKQARNLLPMLIPLFVGAFRRADELAVAMEARAYRGGTGRTRMQPLSMSVPDVLVLAGGSVVMLATGWVF
ncbi:MAG: energy-coupling factor transporter transmembrane protein EcfT [Firmicutes bacterium]|nr:energy-coupling factor transporter transmembrane protein EcfT [Bacillota bacterium]